MSEPLPAWLGVVVAFLVRQGGSEISFPLSSDEFRFSDAEGIGTVFLLEGDQKEVRRLSCKATDIDDLPVIFDAYTNEAGTLTSVDYWKVDYRPVKNWPMSDADLCMIE